MRVKFSGILLIPAVFSRICRVPSVLRPLCLQSSLEALEAPGSLVALFDARILEICEVSERQRDSAGTTFLVQTLEVPGIAPPARKAEFPVPAHRPELFGVLRLAEEPERTPLVSL